MTTAVEPFHDAPDVLQRIHEWLGLPRTRSEHEFIRLVEQGLATKVIDSLRRHGVSDEEIYALVLPRRTLTHRRARREALSPGESDRVVRVARIAALAEHVFGEPARAWRWLRDEKKQFHGRSPLQLTATEAGARLVEAFLYRIDEGMAA